MSDADAQFQRDVRLITRLKIDYARLVDAQDWVKLVECFTDDFRFDGQFSSVGARPFVERMSRQLLTAKTEHRLGIPEISMASGDSGAAVWPFSDTIDQRHQGSGIHRSGSGEYHERYRKSHGRWRISAMRIVRAQVRCQVFVDGIAVRGETVFTQEQLRDWLLRERRQFAQ